MGCKIRQGAAKPATRMAVRPPDTRPGTPGDGAGTFDGDKCRVGGPRMVFYQQSAFIAHYGFSADEAISGLKNVETLEIVKMRFPHKKAPRYFRVILKVFKSTVPRRRTGI